MTLKLTRTYPSGCAYCGGTGLLYRNVLHDSMITNKTYPCHVCNGTGTIIITEVIETNEPIDFIDCGRYKKDKNYGK